MNKRQRWDRNWRWLVKRQFYILELQFSLSEFFLLSGKKKKKWYNLKARRELINVFRHEWFENPFMAFHTDGQPKQLTRTGFLIRRKISHPQMFSKHGFPSCGQKIWQASMTKVYKCGNCWKAHKWL